MNIFEDVIGHEPVKAYFKKVSNIDRISHSYIFEGKEGVGRKFIANKVAKLLLCERSNGVEVCNECKSCHMIDTGNHPDLIKVKKDTKVTKIDTVREKVVKEMGIKPYQSEYKVIIVEEAESMTIESQNAILKTVEEPPAYGVIILITSSIDKLLPTIKSRCINIRFNPLSEKEIENYLIQINAPANKIEIYTKFSNGSIGVAKKLVEEEDFFELRNKSINYLIELEKSNLMGVYSLANQICDQKEKISTILSFWEIWYRDLAIIKTGASEKLYYLDYKGQLLDTISNITYNKISTDLNHIKTAKEDINKNIYNMFVIENLLLKLKKRK